MVNLNKTPQDMTPASIIMFSGDKLQRLEAAANIIKATSDDWSLEIARAEIARQVAS